MYSAKFKNIYYNNQTSDGLKNLQVDVDSWNLILIYILCEKSDEGTRRAFNFELKTGERPSIKTTFALFGQPVFNFGKVNDPRH